MFHWIFLTSLLYRYVTPITVQCDDHIAPTANILRATENGTATFSWSFHSVVPESYWMSCKYGPQTIITMDTAVQWVEVAKSYQGRIAVYYGISDFGFNLTKVTQTDVNMEYTMELYTADLTCVDTARSFIYRTPVIPEITVYPSTHPARGDDVTISCSSEPTSLPAEYQLPINYKWTVNRGEDTQVVDDMYEFVGMRNESILLPDVLIEAGGEITCHATELGSPLSSSNTIILAIRDEPKLGRFALLGIFGGVATVLLGLGLALWYLRKRLVCHSANNINDTYLQTAPTTDSPVAQDDEVLHGGHFVDA